MTDTAQHVETDLPYQPANPERANPELPIERLKADICQLAGQLAAATCRWLLLVADFDRRGGWAGAGVLSCAHWLSWKCGLAPRAAYENLRVAHALEALPKITGAFAAGTLSYSKVRALTRVATGDTEADLLQIALASPAAQLDAIVRAYRRVQRLCDVNARHEQRYLRYHYAEDGSLVGSFRLDPEDGAAVIAGLRTARECSAGQSSDELTHAQLAPSREQADADALVELTKAGATALRADPSQPSADTALAEVVLHVDLATLARSEHRHWKGGRARAHDPRAVGRRSRGPSVALRRAVRGTHHRLLHEGGYSVRGSGDEGFAFCRPDASPIPLCPPAPPLTGGIDQHPASANIDATTILPDWYGDPLDLDYAMAVIFSQRNHRAMLAAAP